MLSNKLSPLALLPPILVVGFSFSVSTSPLVSLSSISFQVAHAAASRSAELQNSVVEVERLWKAGNPNTGFLSAGSSINYGLEYLKTGKFLESIWSFEEAIGREKENAFAHFFLGAARLGQGQNASAKDSLQEAARLNQALTDETEKLLALASSPQMTKPTNATNSNSRPPTPTATSANVAQYKKGDRVEVYYAGQWNPGVLTHVEGSGKSVFVTANFSFQGEPRTGKFWYNGIRRSNKTVPASARQSTPRVGGKLVYGDYVCTLGRWDVSQKRMVFEQKGYFRLNANGTYRYLDGGETGRYSYDAKTGRIKWLSGYFANAGRTTTVFKPNPKVAQIDITFHTKSGDVLWTCGRNM